MLSREVLISEMEGVTKILTGWVTALKAEGVVPGSHSMENGLPSVDYPAPDEALAEAMRQLSAELAICAGKCENLAEVVYSTR